MDKHARGNHRIRASLTLRPVCTVSSVNHKNNDVNKLQLRPLESVTQQRLAAFEASARNKLIADLRKSNRCACVQWRSQNKANKVTAPRELPK